MFADKPSKSICSVFLVWPQIIILCRFHVSYFTVDNKITETVVTPQFSIEFFDCNRRASVTALFKVALFDFCFGHLGAAEQSENTTLTYLPYKVGMASV